MGKSISKSVYTLHLATALLLALPLPARAHVCDERGALTGLDAGGTKQVEHFCTAADEAKKAERSQRQMALSYMGTAAVCATACATSWFAGALEGVCTSMGVATAVEGFVLAKKTGDRIGPLAGLLAPGVVLGAAAVGGVQGILTPGTLLSSSTQTGDINASCVTAGLMAVMSLVSNEGMRKSRDSHKDNREKAQSLAEGLGRALSGAAALGFGGSGAGTGAGAAGQPDGGSFKKTASKDFAAKTDSDPCTSTGIEFAVQCALAQPDHLLPPGLTADELKKGLETLSGRKAEELAEIEDPAALMQATFGNLLNAEGKAKLSDLMSETRVAALGSEAASSLYASSGGKRASKIGAADLSSLLPRQDAAAGSVQAVRLGAVRSPASVAGDEENPAVSLFLRVSNRYRASAEGFSALDASIQNAISTGGSRK